MESTKTDRVGTRSHGTIWSHTRMCVEKGMIWFLVGLQVSEMSKMISLKMGVQCARGGTQVLNDYPKPNGRAERRR